jgi:hypothetical protein
MPALRLQAAKDWLWDLRSNAGAQPRLEAGAQRTLEGVGCTPLFGHARRFNSPNRRGFLPQHGVATPPARAVTDE